MAVRLFEIRRVLKDTGSLYLHCDHTAGAYLRQLLDAVFGKDNFRNEIAWCYTGPGSPNAKQFNRKHDAIFWYSKGAAWHFDKDKSRIPYKDGKPHTGGFTHQSGAKKGTAMDKDVAGKYTQGKILEDWWSDIAIAVRSKHERTGYPTQKPVALAERIIKASCPKGGVVLDCFAGCAYVAVAAEREGRDWLACDINPRAWTVFKRQFGKKQLAPMTCAEPTHNAQPALIGNIVTVHGPNELPTRTTPDHDDAPPALHLQAKPRTFKTPASIIPEREMLELLLELSGYQAWCCGFANRRPDGSIVKTTRNFHLDHLNPVSKAGASHQIVNRAPLCPYHNIMKSNHRLHLAEYREEIAKNGEMMVDDATELIDRTEAAHKTLTIYTERAMQKQAA